MLNTSPRSLALLCTISLALLTSACQNKEAEALKYIEESGCTGITLKTDKDGMITYKATCGGKNCTGFVSINGSSRSNNKVCSTPKSTAQKQTKKANSAPKIGGKTILGQGGVTGYCGKAQVKRTIESLLPKIKTCYNTDLKTYPQMKGSLPMSWTIGTDGKAKDIIIPLGKNPPPIGKCIKGAMATASWGKPEQATCEVQWRVGLYTQKAPTNLGHDRQPRARSCPDPIAIPAGPGETRVKARDLKKILKKSWRLTSLTNFSTSKKDDIEHIHASADQFSDAFTYTAGAAKGRKTLVCHTQNLFYTTTTKRDKNGKETKTRKLSKGSSNRLSANITLPATILAKTGDIKTSRRLKAVLENGAFTMTLTNVIAKERQTFLKMIKEMKKHKTLNMFVAKRGADTLVLKMLLKDKQFSIKGEAVYTSVTP